MKKVVILMLTIGTLLSCNKKNEEILGNVTFGGIFFETDAGLVEAHNYKIEVPAGGGEYDFNLVAIRELSESRKISLDFVDAFQTVIGDGTDKDGHYKGELHLTINENNTGKRRSTELQILSQSRWGLCAIMTISQEK